MATVYMVSAGSYSDYRVLGIFSTKENAAQWMTIYPKEDWNEIEDIVVDEKMTEAQRGLVLYAVIMRRNGDVYSVEVDGRIHVHDWSQNAVFWSNRNTPGADLSCRIYVWAKDEQHAVKIANERRIMALAAEGSRGR